MPAQRIMRERVAPAPGDMIHEDESRAPRSVGASENESQTTTRYMAASRS